MVYILKFRINNIMNYLHKWKLFWQKINFYVKWQKLLIILDSTQNKLNLLKNKKQKITNLKLDIWKKKQKNQKEKECYLDID